MYTTILTTLILAQITPTQTIIPPPTTAEITLTDHSTIRGTLIAQTIQLTTKYGTLIIPTADIANIEPGTRPTTEQTADIKQAIKDLQNPKTKDAATKKLTAYGPIAHTELTKQEPTPQITNLLTKITKPHHQDHLYLKNQQLTSGILTQQTIKIKTTYFGHQQLHLTDIARIHMIYKAAALELDAATENWTDTGLTILPGQTVKITATGTIDLWPQAPGQYMAGPQGLTGTAGKNAAYPAGAIIAKIGTGPEHTIATPTKAQTGKLQLRINPSPWSIRTPGTYKVTIHIE